MEFDEVHGFMREIELGNWERGGKGRVSIGGKRHPGSSRKEWGCDLRGANGGKRVVVLVVIDWIDMEDVGLANGGRGLSGGTDREDGEKLELRKGAGNRIGGREARNSTWTVELGW